MSRTLPIAVLALICATGAGAQAPGAGPPGDVPPPADSVDFQALADSLDGSRGAHRRVTLLVEWSPAWFGLIPWIGLRTEPRADRGFHASLGASVIAHPMAIFTPTGMVEGGLAYSLRRSESLTLVARAGPSVFGSVSPGSEGYFQAGAHGGVSLLLGSTSPRLRLEYTARGWFVEGGNARWPVTQGVGIGLIWGGGR